MEKINFQDLPNTNIPIKASTLNTMQSNIEESCVAVSPTQPETNEKVWIDNENNIIKTKNDDGTFKTIYDEADMNKTNYSINEQVIGTWITGKPIYRKVIQGNTDSNSYVTIDLPNNFENIVSLSGFILDNTEMTNIIPNYWNDDLKIIPQIRDKAIYLTYGTSFINTNYILIVEYTKTTD